MITNNIYQVPIIKDSMLQYKPEIRCSKYMTIPMPSYGYFYYLNKNRQKLNILKTENFKTKTFYNIVNPYELYIPDYDKSIGNMTDEYFNIRGNSIPKITHNDFYKTWELLSMFDLVSTKNNSLHLNDNSECVRATMFYKDKFGSDKSDKFVVQNNVNLNNDVIKFYKTEKKDKLSVVDSVSGEYNLITAFGTLKFNEDSYAEQESYEILLDQLVTAIKCQSKGGNFICKFFDFLTPISIKYLVLLQEVYKNVVLVKPLISRKQDLETFAVCMDFKGADKNMIKKLEELQKEFQNCKKGNLYVNDIFIEYQIPLEMDKFITYVNTQINGEQFVHISDMISYINSGNYYGDKYHDYRQKQIDAQDKWLPLFFPLTQKDIKENKDTITNKLTKIIDNNKKGLSEFMK
jgi:hypothetical protein